MPRLVPSVTRFGYGGMIEGKDYLEVIKVLDTIAETIGLNENSNVLMADLPARVQEELEREREISYNCGRDDGLEQGLADSGRLVDATRQQLTNEFGRASVDHELELQDAHTAGKQEGLEECRATHAGLTSAPVAPVDISAEEEAADFPRPSRRRKS